MSSKNPLPSNKEKVLKYLEKIQIESLIERFGKENYEKEFNELKRKTPPLAAEQIITPWVLTTKYSSPHSSSLLEPLFNKIHNVVTNSDLPPLKTPYIGVAHSLDFNAYAYKFFDIEEYLIVFEGELFILANLLAKIITASLPYSKKADGGVRLNCGKDDIENHIKENPIILDRFKNLVYNIHSSGRASYSTQYMLNKELGRPHYEFLISLELFIVGHEYGHVMGGHLEKSKSVKCMLDNTLVEKFYPDWQMEYEADYLGLMFLQSSVMFNDKHLLPFCLLGPELFFTFLDIQDRAESFFSTGEEQRSEGSEEHPPTCERRERIRRYINKNLNGYVAYQADYNTLSQFLEDVLEILWEKLKQELKPD